MNQPISPRRVLLAVGLGTGLSLIGDSALYTVLPTHTADAGVVLASVGILLSANRWVRLAANGAVGWLGDRWPRRRLFVPALLLGAIATAIYALRPGFGLFLLGRILWGLRGVYGLCVALLGLMLLAALWRQGRQASPLPTR